MSAQEAGSRRKTGSAGQYSRHIAQEMNVGIKIGSAGH